MRIGVDFDNTIVTYDAVFAAAAADLGCLPAGFAGTKQDVRARVTAQPDGQARWMRLQGMVYGARMAEAEPAEGAFDVLAAFRRNGADVFIVSHKTETGHFDEARVNLRDAARAWMEAGGLFDPAGPGIDPGHVFFEPDRAAKIARVAALECSHFIDDLPEVLADPQFPASVERILYAAGMAKPPAGPFRAFRTWKEIAGALLGAPS